MSDLSFIRMFTDLWLEVRAPMPPLADGSKDTPPTVFTRNGKFNDGRLVWMYYNTRTKLFQMAVRQNRDAKPLTLMSRTDATRTFVAVELEPVAGKTYDCDSGEWVADKTIAERDHEETAAVLAREHAEVRAAWARNEELRKEAEEEARARIAKEKEDREIWLEHEKKRAQEVRARIEATLPAGQVLTQAIPELRTTYQTAMDAHWREQAELDL